MAGEIMCKEDEVVNILGVLNTICSDLQNVENDLNGIEADASSLGVTNLNICQVLESINASKEIIKNMMQYIKSLLEGLIKAEQKITVITDTLNEMIKGISNGISIAASGPQFLQNLITKVEVKIADICFELWKDGIEYDLKEGILKDINFNGYPKEFTYYMIEPKNPDPYIPTVFIFDGWGKSFVCGSGLDTIKNYIFQDSDSSWNRRFFPLAALNNGILDKANIRCIFIVNKSQEFSMCGVDTEQFDEKIVGKILADYPQINQYNMSLMSNSGRSKMRSTVCCGIKI